MVIPSCSSIVVQLLSCGGLYAFNRGNGLAWAVSESASGFFYQSTLRCQELFLHDSAPPARPRETGDPESRRSRTHPPSPTPDGDAPRAATLHWAFCLVSSHRSSTAKRISNGHMYMMYMANVQTLCDSGPKKRNRVLWAAARASRTMGPGPANRGTRTTQRRAFKSDHASSFAAGQPALERRRS